MSLSETIDYIVMILMHPLFRISNTVITPLSILVFMLTLLGIYVVSRALRNYLRRRVFNRISIDEKAGAALNHVIHYLLMLIGIVLAFNFMSPESEILQSISVVLTFSLYTINNTSVTPLALISFVVIISMFWFVSQFSRKVLLPRLIAYLKLDDGSSYTFSRILHYLVMVLGILMAFQFVGIDFSGLAVVFGFLSVGIGFGLQNITSNFISGLILLLERPIQVGDRVLVGDTEGDVEEIKIRATKIKSVDNISIIVPNSEFISTRVVNWSHGDHTVRVNVDVGVSYDSDLEAVLTSLKEVATAEPEVLEEPAPEVLLMKFGDSSWDMRLRVWIANPKRHPIVRSKLNCAIVHKFRQNHIEIPYPQRDLHLRSPLPLPLGNGQTPEKEAAPKKDAAKDN